MITGGVQFNITADLFSFFIVHQETEYVLDYKVKVDFFYSE